MIPKMAGGCMNCMYTTSTSSTSGMMYDADYFYSSAPSDISDVTEPELLSACHNEIQHQRVEEHSRGARPANIRQQFQNSRKLEGTSLTRKLRKGLFRKKEKLYLGDR